LFPIRKERKEKEKQLLENKVEIFDMAFSLKGFI
jgi:hypothetical protein